MDRKLLGNIGEAKAKLYFIEKGYEVYTPETVNPAIDFIVMKNGVIKTVQVKATSADSVKLDTCYLTAEGHKRKKFDATLFDYIFIYHQPSSTYKIADAKLYNNKTNIKYSTFTDIEI